MNEISNIKEWFKRAVPEPNDTNRSVQLGCHLEEVAELILAITPDSSLGRDISDAADDAKRGPQSEEESAYWRNVQAKMDRVEVLDALCDQIVTAIGIAHMFGMDIETGLRRVNDSNWSKFDDHGNPIFDENGKIKKGPNYQKVELSDLV